MANPLVGVAQLGVNEFWGFLNQLSQLGKKVRDDLSADRLTLTSLYTQARNDTDKVRGAAHMKALDPVIHNNSVLRLRYQDLVSKFNEAVAGASSMLKKAGLSTPALSGLGVAPIIIIAGAALVALAAAFTIYEAIRVATDAQRKATGALVKILSDPTATPEEKAAAAAALAKGAGTNLFGDLTPLLGIIAVIVVAPPLIRAFSGRRSAA